jgi:cytochrome bd-type quinol oxidase subunit 2
MRARLTALFRGPALLVLGLWLLFIATNPGRNGTIDVGMRQIVARQLWSARSVSVNAIPPGTADFPWVPAGPGRWVAPYGVGQSLLFLPFDMMGAALEHVAPASQRDKVGWLPIGLLLLPLMGVAMWLALCALLREWGLPEPWPVAGASVMSLATHLFHYAGDAQEEFLVGLLLTLAMLFAVRLRRQPTWRIGALAGLCAGAAFDTRSVSMFALLIIPVLVVSAGRDARARIRLLAIVGGVAVATVLISFGYNYARFGNPFVVGYDRLGRFGNVALDGRTPKVIASLLFGPGFGLFILGPALLIGAFGVGELWRRDRLYAVGAMLAYGACYLFFACWHDSYTGGVAWGTRYQIHLLPILALPVTLGLRRLFAAAAGRRAAIAILAVSVVIQALSVFTTEDMEYYQASCDSTVPDAPGAPLRNSPTHGQLGRRVDNVARWALRRPPPALGDETCRATEALVWDRYMPNFWGPVYAHRMQRGGGAVAAFWLAMLAGALAMVVTGLRRGLASDAGAARGRRAGVDARTI